MLSAAFVVAAVLWLAAGVATRTSSGADDWEVPYAAFSVLLMAAAAVSAGAIFSYTSKPHDRSVPRLAAVALTVLAVASTVIAWAFVMWAVLLAAGCAALAATGQPKRRDAGWLSMALLAGLAVALVGLWAKLGPPGEYNDYSEAQDWGVTVACVLATGALARRSRRASTVTGVAVPT